MIPAGNVRRVPDRPEPPPAPVIVPPAPPARRSGAWAGMLAGFAAGGLIAGSLFVGFGHAPGDRDVGLGLLNLLLAGGGSVVLLILVRRRQASRAQPTRAAVSISSSVDTPSDRATTGDHPSGDSSFDRGVRDIRRTDPGFEPARFAGYAAMLFRDAQGAWMTRDIGSLRPRVTPEMYSELQAQCDRLRDTGQTNRVERIEITAEIMEAWQDSGRDYVTASIGGSIVDYTVDAVNDSLVHGSRTIPRDIQEFWTFTRPAGLNFWMLSAIQSGR
jgi:predicted lipid-binding transport protein (Tim44 family)